VLTAIGEADAVVHLGDFTDASVADDLERRATLYAVHGNNDPEEIRQRYPARRDLSIHGHHIILVHGHFGGRSARAAAERVRGGEVVLYGHSHLPSLHHEGPVLLFNPGSPTDRRQAPYRSFGILDIGGEVNARIIPLMDPAI
jgi:putative phosphoesterase